MSNALDVTDTTWDTAVLQSSTPVLVDFWATWCMPCKAMSPYVDKLADEYKSKLKVVKLNTEDNPEVASRYGITAIPTFLIIKNGAVVKQFVGGVRRYEEFKGMVEPHL
jgi:thioredoxin 1